MLCGKILLPFTVIELSNRPTSLCMNDSRLGIGALIGSMNSLKITPNLS